MQIHQIPPDRDTPVIAGRDKPDIPDIDGPDISDTNILDASERPSTTDKLDIHVTDRPDKSGTNTQDISDVDTVDAPDISNPDSDISDRPDTPGADTPNALDADKPDAITSDKGVVDFEWKIYVDNIFSESSDEEINSEGISSTISAIVDKADTTCQLDNIFEPPVKNTQTLSAFPNHVGLNPYNNTYLLNSVTPLNNSGIVAKDSFQIVDTDDKTKSQGASPLVRENPEKQNKKNSWRNHQGHVFFVRNFRYKTPHFNQTFKASIC